jgi:hypothetical protein
MGFRVQRNGPVVTSVSASLNGRRFVFALMNCLAPIAPVAVPTKMGNMPSQRHVLGNTMLIGQSQCKRTITPRHNTNRMGGMSFCMQERRNSFGSSLEMFHRGETKCALQAVVAVDK